MGRTLAVHGALLATMVVVGLLGVGCGTISDPVQRAARTTFVNETETELVVRSEARTYPAFETPLAIGESIAVESLYVRDEHPRYRVSGKLGLAAERVHIRRVQPELIMRGDEQALEADRAVVRLINDGDRLRARAEQGIRVYDGEMW